MELKQIKLRSDRFLVKTQLENIKNIHSRLIEYNDDFKKISENNDSLNIFINICLAFSIEEGFRSSVLKSEEKNLIKKLKSQDSDVAEYTSEEDLKKAIQNFKKKFKSKRQRKRFFENKIDGFEKTEQSFILFIAMNTGFEHGFLKLCQDFEQNIVELNVSLDDKSSLKELKRLFKKKVYDF